MKIHHVPIQSIDHYPPSDFDPAWSSLAGFLDGTTTDPSLSTSAAEIKSRLLLGNGASELIDLCIRMAPGSTWRPGEIVKLFLMF